MKDTTLLCERARGWVSLALDGEISEFERALMATHVERCTECARFAAELRGFTAELRAADEAPLAHPIELPARRRSLAQVARVGAAAAVLALAVGLGGLLASSPAPTSGNAPAPSTPLIAMSTDPDELLRVSQRQALLPLPPRPDRGARFLDVPV